MHSDIWRTSHFIYVTWPRAAQSSKSVCHISYVVLLCDWQNNLALCNWVFQSCHQTFPFPCQRLVEHKHKWSQSNFMMPAAYTVHTLRVPWCDSSSATELCKLSTTITLWHGCTAVTIKVWHHIQVTILMIIILEHTAAPPWLMKPHLHHSINSMWLELFPVTVYI